MREKPAPAPPKPTATPSASVAALYAADLTRAIAGERKVPFDTSGAFGGMTCSPTRLAGTAAASRALTLTLPQDATARAHVLAVVTPERGLLEIYSPYEDAAEGEDLLTPSTVISWPKARGQARFATSTDALDGLRPGKEAPEAVFIEPGRYRFALVNGIDAALLRANGAKVAVIAGCTFDWTP